MHVSMRHTQHLNASSMGRFFSKAAGRNGASDPRYVKRAHPELLQALQQFGIDAAYPQVTYHKNLPVQAESTIDFKLDFYSRVEKGYEKLNEMLADGLLDSDSAEEKDIVTIQGVDNNAIDLHICRPKQTDHQQPHSTSPATAQTCILHIHGGGMSILSTTDPIYRATRLRLAELGFTVIGVEFRNVAGKLGNHRFPCGLNDCMSSLEYVYSNKDKLNIDKIVLLGESGGANLAMSTTLLAKQRKEHYMIDGVYALCPYIYGDYDYASKLGTYPPSLRENDGLLLPRCKEMHSMAMLYLPWGTSPAKNPLAWPYHASRSDLKGLPPHVISVNELDPCRDEGLEYCEKLQEAGVTARSRVVAGTCHAGDLLFMKFIPDIFAATLKDVDDFVKTL